MRTGTNHAHRLHSSFNDEKIGVTDVPVVTMTKADRINILLGNVVYHISRVFF